MPNRAGTGEPELTKSLRGKTLFITGASRGVGKAVAERAARDGANIVIAAKTAEPHPKLPGTIYDAAQAIEALGGHALPLVVDVRSEEQVREAVLQGVKAFGGIDILVNNASAISMTGTAETPVKRVELMLSVNVRGTFTCVQACLPWLERAANPHILTMSPPPNLAPRWFKPFAAYATSKMAMTLMSIGMAEEFRDKGIAVNTLWPRTVIATSALGLINYSMEAARKPAILADAAYEILCSDSRSTTGNWFVDEDVLRAAGRSEFDDYSMSARVEPTLDWFIDG